VAPFREHQQRRAGGRGDALGRQHQRCTALPNNASMGSSNWITDIIAVVEFYGLAASGEIIFS
jgi:hypothetical protein